MHAYRLCPRKDHRGVDLISDALPFGPEPDAVNQSIRRRKRPNVTLLKVQILHLLRKPCGIKHVVL
jgi:hypothetical protein